jgi:putative two-component system response regulator
MVDILSKILFIDDDENFLAAMKRIIALEKYPWQVTFRSSALDAFSSEDLSDYDVILSDMMMPERDGFWVIEQLQKNPETSSIPVIVLSGNGEGHLKHKALIKGATDFLNKPIQPDDLYARIHSALRLKGYQDELKRRNKILEKEVLRRTQQLEFSHMEIIWKLAKAGEFRDEQTGFHVARVGYFSRLLAQKAGLPVSEVDMIFITSPLHDIGKIGVPDYLLHKPFPFLETETIEMHRHCEYGVRILLESSAEEIQIFQDLLHGQIAFSPDDHPRNLYLEKAAEIVLSHHENWDGSGYPHGTKGFDIPVAGRIVAIADSYDAFRSVRPYKPAYSEEEAYKFINNESGHRFDPNLVEIFNQSREEFQLIWNKFHSVE